MKTIRSVKCVYAIEREAWAIVLTFDDGDHKRFVLDPDRIPMFLRAFDDASEALYDDGADEIILSFEYAGLTGYEEDDDSDDEDLDDEESDEDDDDEDEDEDEDEEKSASKKKRKKHQ